MKKLLVLLIFLLPFSLLGKSDFNPFIQAQLKIINQMEKNDINQTEMLALIQKQESMYSSGINQLLSSKKEYLENTKMYKSDIFSLRKIQNLNKRLGNEYAVIRDEVKIKTYLILDAQTKMVKQLLKALNDKTFDEYQEYASDIFAQNQIEVAKIQGRIIWSF